MRSGILWGIFGLACAGLAGVIAEMPMDNPEHDERYAALLIALIPLAFGMLHGFVKFCDGMSNWNR